MSFMRHRAVVAVALTTLVALALSTIEMASSSAAPGDPEMWPGAWSADGPDRGSILAADVRGSVAAGYGGDIVALGPDGTELWRSSAGGNEVGNDLALLPDLVVVPSNDRVTAFDRPTGARRWERAAEESRVGSGALSDGTAAIAIADAGGTARPRGSSVRRRDRAHDPPFAPTRRGPVRVAERRERRGRVVGQGVVLLPRCVRSRAPERCVGGAR